MLPRTKEIYLPRWGNQNFGHKKDLTAHRGSVMQSGLINASKKTMSLLIIKIPLHTESSPLAGDQSVFNAVQR